MTALIISPGSISLQPDASFTFAATGQQSDGASVPVSVTWTATGGTITGTGVYTAGSATGTLPRHRDPAGRHTGRHVRRHGQQCTADLDCSRITPRRR